MVNIQFLYDLGRLSCLDLEYTFTGFMGGGGKIISLPH